MEIPLGQVKRTVWVTFRIGYYYHNQPRSAGGEWRRAQSSIVLEMSTVAAEELFDKLDRGDSFENPFCHSASAHYFWFHVAPYALMHSRLQPHRYRRRGNACGATIDAAVRFVDWRRRAARPTLSREPTPNLPQRREAEARRVRAREHAPAP